jgi:hypothetical protein
MGHVVSMGQKINVKFWKEILQERETLNHVGLDLRVTIKQILENRIFFELIWLRKGINCIELPGFIKLWKFVYYP